MGVSAFPVEFHPDATSRAYPDSDCRIIAPAPRPPGKENALLAGITILLCYQLGGEILARWSGLPVPGPVLGMVMLLCGLMSRGKVSDGLQRLTDSLLGVLTLLFVPAAVGVGAHLDLLERESLPIAAAVIGGTLITMAVTGWVMQALNRGNSPEEPPE